MLLWKFTKGSYKGLTALVIDREKIKDGVARSKDRNLITLYVNEEIVSFTKEALEQIAIRLEKDA